MKDKNIIIIVAVLLVVLGGVLFLVRESPEQKEKLKHGAAGESNIHKASLLFVENFVKEGIEVYKQDGLTGLIAGDYESYLRGRKGTYLYVIDKDKDLILFNPAHPQLIGTKASEIKTSTNEYIVRDIIYKEAAPEGKWVSYRFIDPFDLREKEKEAYVILVDDSLIFGAGIYLGD